MSEREFYDRSRKLLADEFGQSFSSFRTSAFRLETLQTYTVPEEKAAYDEFLRTGFVKEGNQDWYALIGAWTSDGKKFQRVRLVEQPITPYLSYEIQAGYFQSIKNGEEIRIIDRVKLQSIWDKLPIQTDFWCFDDELVILMWYDQIGRFIGGVHLDKRDSIPYIDAKNKLILLTTPASISELKKLI